MSITEKLIRWSHQYLCLIENLQKLWNVHSYIILVIIFTISFFRLYIIVECSNFLTFCYCLNRFTFHRFWAIMITKKSNCPSIIWCILFLLQIKGLAIKIHLRILLPGRKIRFNLTLKVNSSIHYAITLNFLVLSYCKILENAYSLKWFIIFWLLHMW